MFWTVCRKDSLDAFRIHREGRSASPAEWLSGAGSTLSSTRDVSGILHGCLETGIGRTKGRSRTARSSLRGHVSEPDRLAGGITPNVGARAAFYRQSHPPDAPSSGVKEPPRDEQDGRQQMRRPAPPGDREDHSGRPTLMKVWSPAPHPVSRYAPGEVGLAPPLPVATGHGLRPTDSTAQSQRSPRQQVVISD